MNNELSSLFTYQYFEVMESTVAFFEVALLHDLHTHKGIYIKGTEFAEATLEIPTLLLTLYHDHPHIGYITECEINLRLEQDL